MEIYAGRSSKSVKGTSAFGEILAKGPDGGQLAHGEKNPLSLEQAPTGAAGSGRAKSAAFKSLPA